MPELQAEYIRMCKQLSLLCFFIHSRWLPGNKILLSVSVIYWPILLVIVLLQLKTGPPFGQEEMSKKIQRLTIMYI